MANIKPIRIATITEAHRLFGLPRPEHPLINILDFAALQNLDLENTDVNAVFDFYFISLKKGCGNKLQYGQQTYDFDEGMMMFVGPGQILKGESSSEDDISGWGLLFHPDLLWGTSLANKMKKYEFFDYSVNEALFLSDKEEAVLNGIIENIKNEYHSNIDKFSQDIIVSHLETLLKYAERFYQRQFITRKISNHQILDKLDTLLTDYFNNDDLISKGLPTVQYISDNLNVSANYLRSLLKTLTGLSTQQHIHDKLIENAKEKLSTTQLSVSEIAYELGFEHLQSFSKLFKAKTKVSPLEFRKSFI
ncbi:transcriptional regulator, AraC family [Chryseobacterium arachidis]|uniref:Transcriptional regulator, AraC family n=1 Tax=Chryseobacterium arachidis TaxID=1416778 RepID=A0A1M5HUA7_9FLAO|nr:response regulator transcription factor [Chryseobacterium arachidis]SHG19534.1 transcriptional regulator, AraC family [Chryseobacterium arachidis]